MFSRFLIIIVSILALAFIYVFYSFYSMGKNFVHDRPASEEYYQNISNRIYFTTKFRGETFDTLLTKFLKSNSQYSPPDSINPHYIWNSGCDCDCLPLEKFVYFENPPKEIYYLTYDHDSMQATGAGVIDLIFLLKNKQWSCIKTSTLDSTEKARVESRLSVEILNKLE